MGVSCGLVGTPVALPLSPADFARAADEALVLDTRQPPAYLASHVAGALSIWRDGVAGWGGWFLPDEGPVLLVTDDADRLYVYSTLLRMGFGRISGFLEGGMHSWHTAGLETRSSGAVGGAVRRAALRLLRQRPAFHGSGGPSRTRRPHRGLGRVGRRGGVEFGPLSAGVTCCAPPRVRRRS